ncbi:hypothetical protein M2277_005026 [Paenibacillus sp. LBL]|uniref:hypothetical protein n=1 Tax=Paenibacillus sp. LBL TaxID=2940563 RepID=UPI002476E576|nr:hypothetical protein [Paenibacillus sp. LBL]MDH6674334.1 hypothetical protein [Paenibacillus sp. LBL]
MSKIMDQLIGNLGEGIQRLSAAFSLELDYSPKSLLRIESFINKQFPNETELDGSMSIMLGLYLGEVIIRNNPGLRWNEPEIENKVLNPFDLSITIPIDEERHLTLKPMLRIHKFGLDRTDTIYGYYNMNIDIYNKVFDPTSTIRYKGDHYEFKLAGMKKAK